MICYRDITFCIHWKTCNKGKNCEYALTSKVKKSAEKRWDKFGTPIYYFLDKQIVGSKKMIETIAILTSIALFVYLWIKIS